MKLFSALAQEPTVFLLRKLWRFSAGMHARIVTYTCMFVGANCASLLPPIIFGAMVREVQGEGITQASLPHILSLLGLLFANVLLVWALHGPARVLERVVAFKAELNYRRELLGRVLESGLTWHGRHESGDIIDRVNKASEGLTAFGQNVFQVITVVVRLLGTAAALCWFAPSIGALAFGMVLLSLAVILRFDRRLVPQHQGLNRFSNRASAKVFDVLSNITTAKILHIEQPLLRSVMARYADSYPLFRANVALHEHKWFAGAVCFQAVAVVPLAIYICVGVWRGERIDAGTLSTLYMYLTSFTAVYSSFSGFYQEVTIYKQRVLNAAPIEAALADIATASRRSGERWQRLHIGDVAFSYSGTDAKSNLVGVSVQLQRGERIALIGESGAGKSTFLKVIHGMYDGAKGCVQADDGPSLNTNFADIDLKTMLVPQEPEVFFASIRENITLGLEYTDVQIMHAARLSTFDKVLAKIPEGLDSLISEKGVNLSGGQKQRLALTRALLFAADKDILLLDESTSSVNPQNELAIYENIWSALGERSVLACVHKLNLLHLFDRIILFAGGQVADEGTFEALLTTNATFRAQWQRYLAAHPGATQPHAVTQDSAGARQ